MRLLTRALLTGLTGGALALVVTFGSAHHPVAKPAAAPVAESAPGYAVEDYAYPNADQILAEQGIVLKRGDGHIVLADCNSASGLLEVWSRDLAQDRVCFQATSEPGELSLEIPSVYLIVGAGDTASKVTMTYNGTQTSYDVPQAAYTPVGEGADPGHEYALLDIVTSG